MTSNGKFSPNPDINRQFKAVKEFFKLLRRDMRLFGFYKPQKAQVGLYSIDWLFASGNYNYRMLSMEFMNWLLTHYPNEIDWLDFV